MRILPLGNGKVLEAERVGLWTTGAEGHAHNREMARTDRERMTLMPDEKLSDGSPK